MTDSDYTLIVILADRTGSMGAESDPGRTRAQDATEGIKTLIAEQKVAGGKTRFCLVDFHSRNLVQPILARHAWFADGNDDRLMRWRCMPYGNTPLLDAVGTVIADVGEDLAKLPESERPGKVYFVIATDGEENSSRKYTLPQVKTMVTEQQDKYGWEFIFIGAGIDAFAVGHAMGVSGTSTLSASASNFSGAYRSSNSAMLRARAGGQSVSFTSEERDNAK